VALQPMTPRNRYPLGLLRTSPTAAAADVLCQHWTPLIIREVMLGNRRFGEIRRELGIATNSLAARLRQLVAEGVLEQVAYCERPQRAEYHLTGKGRALLPILTQLEHWGRAHALESSVRDAKGEPR
jgi:DNA-binding HxlR family transcriptional regulator